MTCGEIQVAVETTQMIASLMDLWKEPLDYLADWEKEILTKNAAKALRVSGSSGPTIGDTVSVIKGWLGVADAVDAHTPGEGPGDIPKSVVEAVNATVTFLSKAAFDHYCERFEGPVESSFHCEYKNPDWSYDLKIAGRLLIVYPKNATKGSDVTGWIEGNFTDLKMHENLATELDPKLRPFLWLRHVFNPPLPPTYISGGYRGLNTTYFRIPVRGDIVGNKVVLDLASQDSGRMFHAKVLYIFNTHTLTPPYVQWFDMPIQDGTFVLTRGMGTESHWQIAISGKTMLLRREFTRTYDDPNGGFHLEWETKVKACNPGCMD